MKLCKCFHRNLIYVNSVFDRIASYFVFPDHISNCFQQFEGNSPFNLYVSPVSGTNGVDALMLGMADRLANKFDSSFAFTIRERLFREKPGVQGLDLPALNVQRARDHGVAGAC